MFGKNYVLNANMGILDCLFQSWISQILFPHPIIECYMDTANITFPKNIMLKKFYVFHTVKKGCEKLLVCASNSAKKQGNAKSNVGIQLIINIANTSQLSNVYHGNISALEQAIGCCFRSAKVLNAVRNN